MRHETIYSLGLRLSNPSVLRLRPFIKIHFKSEVLAAENTKKVNNSNGGLEKDNTTNLNI